MINKVFLSGYLSKYIHTGQTKKGGTWVNAQLAQYTGDPNNKYQYTPIVAFDGEKTKPASRLAQAQGGDYVVLECHVKVDKEQRDGRNVPVVSLVVDSVRDVITPSPRESAPQTAQNRPQTAPQNYEPYQNNQQSDYPSEDFGGIYIGSEDLPF